MGEGVGERGSEGRGERGDKELEEWRPGVGDSVEDEDGKEGGTGVDGERKECVEGKKKLWMESGKQKVDVMWVRVNESEKRERSI